MQEETIGNKRILSRFHGQDVSFKCQEPSKVSRSNGFGGTPRLGDNSAVDTPGPGTYTWDSRLNQVENRWFTLAPWLFQFEIH